MCKTNSILVCGLIFLSSFAFAETSKSNGFYYGINLGYANVNEKIVAAYGGSVTSKTDGFGWNINAGYLFNNYFALEINFLSYPNEKFDPVANGENNCAGALAAVGILPFDNGLSVFGKLGFAGVHHSLIANSNYFLDGGNVDGKVAIALFCGVGIGYAITQHVGLNIGANITSKNGNIPSMWQTTMGLSYLF